MNADDMSGFKGQRKENGRTAAYSKNPGIYFAEKVRPSLCPVKMTGLKPNGRCNSNSRELLSIHVRKFTEKSTARSSK
jgi:hypothetical protein